MYSTAMYEYSYVRCINIREALLTLSLTNVFLCSEFFPETPKLGFSQIFSLHLGLE
jgi:hypothetical protein